MINISHNKQLTEFDFWKCYFKLLDLNKFKKEKFSEFEIDSLATVMSENIQKSPFKNEQRKNLVKKLNNLGYKLDIANVHTRIIKPFLKRNIIYKSEDDLALGEYSINKSLLKIKNYINICKEKNKEIDIKIDYNFIIDGKN